MTEFDTPVSLESMDTVIRRARALRTKTLVGLIKGMTSATRRPNPPQASFSAGTSAKLAEMKA
jgi:hypothetical protein